MQVATHLLRMLPPCASNPVAVSAQLAMQLDPNAIGLLCLALKSTMGIPQGVVMLAFIHIARLGEPFGSQPM